MQFLTDTHIPFMKYRRFFVWFSAALLIVAIGELFFLGGLNLGIDFTGGTQLTVKLLDEDLNVDQIRDALSDAGLREAQIQSYGQIEDREILIKMPVKAGSEEGTAIEITDALTAAFNADLGTGLDLNQRGRDSLTTLLVTADPDGIGSDPQLLREHYGPIATAVIEQRQTNTAFTSFDQVRATPGLSEEAAAAIEDGTYVGRFLVRSTETVGPQIGSELRTKGILAVVLSLLGMLMYIWYRFELHFAIGAIVAVFHDFLITLGLFALFDFEFNLATIAAFLTLVGYSVNDTVVIFDRVRENLRRFRRRSLEDLMDLSINQTLSRTALTSGTTLLVVGSLFFAGGEVLRGFAFVMMIGVTIGTYSSIFVASPFALLWDQKMNDGKAAKRPSGAADTSTRS